MATVTTASPSAGGTVPTQTALAALEEAVRTLAAADFADLGPVAQGEAMTALEVAAAAITAAKARLVTTVDADGTWTLDGARSLSAWVRTRTGCLDAHAARGVKEARILRDHLPAAAEALAAGRISPDHVTVLVRAVSTSPLCLEMLRDPEVGEDWLVETAATLDASRFNTLLKHWVTRTDPHAADRRWIAESEREEFSLAKTMDGHHGRLWLSDANGTLVRTALDAWAGRSAKDDTRNAAQRRAAALVELVGAYLDTGGLKPGARIRPHLAVTATVESLFALARAQRASDDGPSCGGCAPDEQAPATDRDCDHPPVSVIPAALDLEALRGVEPARLEDGTPIPFGLFARLACESHMHRVIFGPDSEILDVGREHRLFTAGQTRGILARDGSCRFPDCSAPAGTGEIHHSLWWYAHHGPTDTKNGILLCRYHHTYVHQHQILIERHLTHWRFTRSNGTTIGTTVIQDHYQPLLE